MYKTISNEIIRKFDPCYDPSKVIIDENEELSVKQWVEKYRNVVPAKDILWLLLRKEFLSEKDLRLFAVWCAREALKLVENPDERIVEACNVAEKYANREATQEELHTAYYVALNAACRVYNDASDAAFHAAATTLAATRAAANATLAADHASDAAYYATLNVAHDTVYSADAHDYAAYYAASAAAYDAVLNVALDTVSSADAHDYAASAAAYDASNIARTAQVDKLLSYFN
jgi:hypothetical protein